MATREEKFEYHVENLAATIESSAEEVAAKLSKLRKIAAEIRANKNPAAAKQALVEIAELTRNVGIERVIHEYGSAVHFMKCDGE